ncbi:MAG TPA: NAD(P)H-dependent oxidoreductase [Xanthobacteraceae bacterium]|nr:NAD(P)H-dependent oxidoreductase [Xanthobacteraceae bacterium]
MPITSTKILVFSGSIRSGSFNSKLAALMVKELTLIDAEVTQISLADYPMPIYNGDDEQASGQPENAKRLKRHFMANSGIFIASPEYNASVTPLLKNTLDWISRIRDEGEPPLAAYKKRIFAIGGASPGPYGAMRSHLALRQVLEIGCGAMVIPDFITVRDAGNAFDDKDNLKDERSAKQLKLIAQRLVEYAQQVV